MTLYQLGDEYLKGAKDLETLISTKRKESKNLSGIRLYEVNGEIACLREMQREMRITGQTLKGYYSDKPQGRIYHARERF